MTAQRREVAIPGGTMSCLVWEAAGPSAPLLVFCHATGLNAGAYRRLLEPLADRFRIIAVDQRGHGMSRLPDDPALLRGWHLYREDLAAFLRTLGEPPLLAGHSMGASVATLTAARYPDLMRGVLLVEPALIAPPLAPYLGIQRLFGHYRVFEIARRAARRRAVWPDRASMIEAWAGRGAFTSWPEGWLEDYVEGGTRDLDDGQVTLACTPEWESWTFRTATCAIWVWLARLRVPAILLKGTVNSTVMMGSRAAFVALVRHASARTIEGASHFLPQERPDLVREAIVELAGEADRRG